MFTEVLKHLQPLERAIVLATFAHNGQTDKLDRPYVLHPLHVMGQMLNEQTRIVAILHDVVEDTAMSLDYIRDLFGDVIADAVDAISKRDDENYREYLTRLKENKIATIVKMADIEHNLLPARLRQLSPDSQIYLEEKYQKALDFLAE